MDRNSPDFLIEETNQSLVDTKEWLEKSVPFGPLVKPIITPRFVPSCTSELMSGLGKLAEEYNVPIQSHLSEITVKLIGLHHYIQSHQIIQMCTMNIISWGRCRQ